MELRVGDIVRLNDELSIAESPLFNCFRTPGIVVDKLGEWGYMIHWPLEGYRTSEKARYLIKLGHVDET